MAAPRTSKLRTRTAAAPGPGPAAEPPADSPPPHSAEPPPSPAFAPPPGNPRFPLFDGLRGLAVLGVVAFHASETTGHLGFGLGGRAAEVMGGQAVIVFFAISGFLLYRPYVSARARGRPLPSTRRYARRRAFRILPGYWTVLTVLAIFPGIVGVFTGDWWRYYGYLQLYSARTQGGGIPVAWTLCVEVTFYILLPFWALGVRRVGRPAGTRELLRAELVPLAVVAVLALAVQVAASRQIVSPLVGASLLGNFAWLALGMALAVVSVAAHQDESALKLPRRLGERPELCWLVAGAAFAGLVAIVPSGGLFGLIAVVGTPQALAGTILKLTLTGILAGFLILPVVFGSRRRGLPRRLLSARPMDLLGVISYSFYLWHLTLMEWIWLSHDPGHFSSPGLDLSSHIHFAPTLVLYVVTLLATAALATLSYRFIELPFLRHKES
ncbi:MAG TPA: acyltransferase [Solirubrobacteraceae bacterium]|nr:acyltransferase [Solirubrobacteraceae bacterium]